MLTAKSHCASTQTRPPASSQTVRSNAGERGLWGVFCVQVTSGGQEEDLTTQAEAGRACAKLDHAQFLSTKGMSGISGCFQAGVFGLRSARRRRQLVEI